MAHKNQEREVKQLAKVYADCEYLFHGHGLTFKRRSVVFSACVEVYDVPTAH